MITKKNTTLEVFKLFAAYMVVFIHVLFDGRVGEIIDAVARFAVPLFFLISGYFSYQISTDKIKMRTKHIFKLFLLTSIIYNIYHFVDQFLMYGKNGAISFLNHRLNPTALIKLILLNDSKTDWHVWYLLAILYVYIIYYFATKFHVKEKVIFIVGAVLLVVHMLLDEGSFIIAPNFDSLYVRNFALSGIPYFSMGLFVRKYIDKFRATPNYVAVITAIMGVIFTIVSRYITGKNNLYIGSLFILFSVVVTFVKYPDVKYPRFVMAITSCSTYIYIFHRLVAQILVKIYQARHIDINTCAVLRNIHPILVCIITTILSYVIIKITNKKALKKIENK